MKNIDFKYSSLFSGYCLSQIEEHIGKRIDVGDWIDGSPSLHFFSLFSRMDLIKELLDRGENIDCVDSAGDTLLMYGAGVMQTNNDLLELALSSGANVNAANNIGDTALHLAVEQGYMDRVEIILRHGVDVSIENNEGETALDYAIKRMRFNISELLMSYSQATYESIALNSVINADDQHNNELLF